MSDRVEQTICIIDVDDFGRFVDAHRIEIQALDKNGGFQKIMEIHPEKISRGSFHSVLKICHTGQRSQSNVAPEACVVCTPQDASPEQS